MAFTVRDLEDLIRLLDKHPAWMEALRQRMLTKDLLESPKTLKRLSTRVGKVEKALQALTESVAALAEAQRRHYEEFATHRQEFLAYRAEADRRFAELREEVAAARTEADRRFAELAEAQRRGYEEFAAFRAEVERRFAELREEVAAARAEADRRFAALAEAQRRTEERVGRLEETVAALAEAQRRTEERVGRLEEVVAALAEAQRRTEERVGRLEETVAALAEAQRRHYEEFAAFRVETERRFAELIRTVERLAEAQERTEKWVMDIDGRLRGEEVESEYRTVRRRYRLLVRDPHILSREEREALLQALEERGALEAEEAAELEAADVIVRGRRREGEGEAYLVVEVSVTVHTKDVARAARRAAALQRALPEAEVRAVVAGPKIHAQAREAAVEHGVWWLTDSLAFAPHEIPEEQEPPG